MKVSQAVDFHLQYHRGAIVKKSGKLVNIELRPHDLRMVSYILQLLHF